MSVQSDIDNSKDPAACESKWAGNVECTYTPAWLIITLSNAGFAVMCDPHRTGFDAARKGIDYTIEQFTIERAKELQRLLEQGTPFVVDLSGRIETKCHVCGDVKCFNLDPAHVAAYRNGGLVQRCFPYLDSNDRERIVSGTCPKCWDNMMAGLDDVADRMGDDE